MLERDIYLVLNLVSQLRSYFSPLRSLKHADVNSENSRKFVESNAWTKHSWLRLHTCIEYVSGRDVFSACEV